MTRSHFAHAEVPEHVVNGVVEDRAAVGVGRGPGDVRFEGSCWVSVNEDILYVAWS